MHRRIPERNARHRREAGRRPIAGRRLIAGRALVVHPPSPARPAGRPAVARHKVGRLPLLLRLLPVRRNPGVLSAPSGCEGSKTLDESRKGPVQESQ